MQTLAHGERTRLVRESISTFSHVAPLSFPSRDGTSVPHQTSQLMKATGRPRRHSPTVGTNLQVRGMLKFSHEVRETCSQSAYSNHS
ncbi:hypothetical protein GMOD_00002657 [Pyrenophora seminiperda CCB06]|uniref:Uncharacterized protein n=1 Tax=Pyrenophora seminiperda CCB06 TaxID=1302712 RepID=A0A3M7M2U9_9PLEO|nr:hypothetical protein GMOD_00002657 [Pyrenophora seminiperda CCB06]